ncbi:YeeE/YedE thiosulfate transporter family protein, partial [Ruegeria sp. NA]
AERNIALSFGIGLVPGVAIGAAVSAVLSGEWKIEQFGPDTPMERYLVGAVLMGFGAMLAGGCAVGAGLSGGSALSLTAWLAVFSMWVGAVATHRMMMRMPVLRRS